MSECLLNRWGKDHVSVSYTTMRNSIEKSFVLLKTIPYRKTVNDDISFLEQNLTADDSGNAVFRINVGKNLSKIKTADLKLLDGKWLITNITTQN